MGSTWAHVLAGVALVLVPQCESAEQVTPDRAITLVALLPSPTAAADERPSPEPDGAVADTAATSGDPLDAQDALAATALPDPAPGSQPAPSAAGDDLALAADPASDTATDPHDPSQQVARTDEPPRPSAGANKPDDSPDSADFDPNDAVADAATSPSLDPLRAELEPPEVDPVIEEPPEPEEVVEPEEPKDQWQTYLRVEDADAISDENVDSNYIGRTNARAEEVRQAHVTSDQYGAPTPPMEAVPLKDGRLAIEQADGTPDGSLGDAPAAGTPVPTPTAPKIGGGISGDAPGRGSPESGSDQRGGDPARSGRRAESARSAVAATPSSMGVPGTKESPNPDNELALRRAAWWSPAVVRVVRPTRDATAAVAPVTAPLPTQGNERAPEPRPDLGSDRGGTDQDVDVDEPTPEANENLAETDSGEADPIEEVEAETPPIETVADLREAMGWGGINRMRLAPKRSVPGVGTADASEQTSQQTVAESLMVERFAIVDARATPRGRYRAILDDEIAATWKQMDLSLHERALGIQGDVTVLFRIKSNGKVLDKSLVRSSGHNSLDSIAMDAVPRKLPRIPRDVDANVIAHLYTFHYRNPMIVGGQRTP